MARHPKHAAAAGLLAAGAAGLGLAGLWPLSCLLCVEIGVQWVKAWGWRPPEATPWEETP
jgi:hypothetical protein